jgi:VanZ family protein
MGTSPNSPAAIRAWHILATLYLACLSWMLLTPDPWILLGDTGDRLAEQVERTLADHFQHAAAFALLAILAQLALRDTRAGRFPIRTAMLLAYASTTEAAQSLIPNRHFEWSDLAANLAGLVVGMLLGRLLPGSADPPGG